MTTIADLSVKVGLDAAELEEGADRATSTIKGVGDEAERASPKVDNMGSGLDRVGESADGAETRFTGLASGIDGVTTLMADPSPQEFAQGLADIADGVANSLIPTLKQFGTVILSNARSAVVAGASHVKAAALTALAWVKMGAQALVQAARMAAAWLISLGPVGLIIAAVAAVIAILVSLGVGFDDIKRFAMAAWEFILGAIKAVWNWISENWPLILAILTGPIGLAVLFITRNWERIKQAFGAAMTWIRDRATGAKDWLVARFNDVVSFVTGLPARIATAASGLFDGFKSAFKSAVNTIIGWWNGISFTLPSIEIPGFDPPGPGSFGGFTIGGQTFSTPNLPTLAEGGIIRHRPGGILANIGEGRHDEAVVPLPRGMAAMGGARPTVVLHVAGSIRTDREIVRLIRDEIDRGGFDELGGFR